MPSNSPHSPQMPVKAPQLKERDNRPKGASQPSIPSKWDASIHPFTKHDTETGPCFGNRVPRFATKLVRTCCYIISYYVILQFHLFDQFYYDMFIATHCRKKFLALGTMKCGLPAMLRKVRPYLRKGIAMHLYRINIDLNR